MIASLALALLSAAVVDVPAEALTEEQRRSLSGTVKLRVAELSDDQLLRARQQLTRELEVGDFGRKATGLITAGSVLVVSGTLLAGFAFLVIYGDAPPAMFAGGTALAIGGHVMLGLGLVKAGTRAAYLERIEAVESQIRTRILSRETPPPRGGGKRFAHVFQLTVAEF